MYMCVLLKMRFDIKQRKKMSPDVTQIMFSETFFYMCTHVRTCLSRQGRNMITADGICHYILTLCVIDGTVWLFLWCGFFFFFFFPETEGNRGCRAVSERR